MDDIPERLPLPKDVYITLAKEYKIPEKPNISILMKIKENSFKIKNNKETGRSNLERFNIYGFPYR